MQKKNLLKVIEDNEIDGQVFVTLRSHLEWVVILYPYRSEIIDPKKNTTTYEAIVNLAEAISNIVKQICSNGYTLGGSDLKDINQLRDMGF